MNAVNFLSRSLADAKLTDALERADCWIDSARPVIKAYLELDQIDGDLCLAGHAFQNDGDLIGRSATDEARSEEHTSELQSLMRISYAVFCLKKKNPIQVNTIYTLLMIIFDTNKKSTYRNEPKQLS